MVKKRNEAGARGLSPEGAAAGAKRRRRQTAKDDRARRRRTGGTPSRAQGVRQRAGGADRAAGAGRQQGCLFCCDKRSPGRAGALDEDARFGEAERKKCGKPVCFCRTKLETNLLACLGGIAFLLYLF